ncbi:MAG: TRAP transporter small permease [Desulfofustis sp.]|nr:TRAP transporter small permease [Desulfofustis sp.]
MALKKTVGLFDRYSRTLAILGGWALLGLSLYVGIDVIGRKLFALSLQGSDEIGGYILAIVCAAGFSHTLSHRSHIRLNALLSALPSGIQAAANLLAYTLLLLLAFMMLWRSSAMLFESISIRAVAPTPLETPLWIPQGLYVLGLLWFFLHVAVCLFHAVSLAVRGLSGELNETYGVEQRDANERDMR